MRCLSAVLAAAALAVSQAAYAPDKITSLPGWSGALPSEMYGGYLDIPGGKHLSYVTAFSENNPAKDPTVFWFNGGPGCSSLGGFATENGPFFILKEAGKWALRQRPERWNKAANMVWMENPAGVGFSYADSASGYVHNDTGTAVDNYNAVQAFFNKFPEWRNNSLFFTGESYAGIYIPTLAQEVVEHNQAGAEHINLKGIAVGNGCIGTEVGTCGQGGTKYNFEFLSGQGFLSPDLVSSIEKDCTNWVNPSSACQSSLVDMYAQEGNVNVYDVYVGCGALAGDDDGQNQGTYSWTSGGVPDGVVGSYEAFMARRFKQRPATDLEKTLLAAVWAKKVAAAGGARALGASDGPCVAGNAYTAWFNDATVRAALHMKPSADIGAWTDCTNKIDYTSNVANEPRDVYPLLVANMNVLIYNGAFDNCVPWTDNAEWTAQFAAVNNAPVAKAWSPWYVDSHLAGHSQYWDIGHGFGFTTIVAAGHLVPQYQPKFGAAMLQAFLAGKQL